ncbi:MAG: DUF21 domain-containing protein [Phycisphaerales bacterium]
MTERGSRAGQRLQIMKDDVDRPLAAILTLNTFAHTLGAAGVGAQSAVIWGEAWVGVVGVVVTLAILIFSEIIPKTLGAVHAKRLASFTAWTVHWMILILYPIVVACDRISKLLAGRKMHAPIISREEMHSLAQLAHEEGARPERGPHPPQPHRPARSYRRTGHDPAHRRLHAPRRPDRRPDHERRATPLRARPHHRRLD